MISLDRCTGSSNVLSPKICASKKTQDINVIAFNMITNKNEAKTITKNISYDCKCKFSSTKCNLNQKWNNKTCQCEGKNYRKCKKYYSWNPSTGICENSKYLKGIADTSVIECDKIISVVDIVTTKTTNTIAKNAAKYCDNKKKRHKFDCYILCTALSAIILLLIIIIICYHYARQKDINAITI